MHSIMYFFDSLAPKIKLEVVLIFEGRKIFVLDNKI